jgi:hypothetical protein
MGKKQEMPWNLKRGKKRKWLIEFEIGAGEGI